MNGQLDGSALGGSLFLLHQTDGAQPLQQFIDAGFQLPVEFQAFVAFGEEFRVGVGGGQQRRYGGGAARLDVVGPASRVPVAGVGLRQRREDLRLGREILLDQRRQPVVFPQFLPKHNQTLINSFVNQPD